MSNRRSKRQLILIAFVIIPIIVCCQLISYVDGSSITSLQNEIVCKSIDVRNSVANFKANLENCTVIEGFLRILLIDRASPSDYANLTFPKLREITDYFLLFRVTGLKTLRHLFPNLAVIRGSNLFHNYAFVIYEMMDLQEIGIPALTNVIRGGVRIEKNPKLCYVETIDWDHMSKGGNDAHFFKANSGENECPNSCPDATSGQKCPLSPKTSKKNSLLCWSAFDCQKICNKSCGEKACEDNLETCCHPECLGGCNGKTQEDCYACKNFLFQGKCTGSCPENTFMYRGRRCLTAQECIKMKYFDQELGNITFKPIKGQCSSSCPSGYTEAQYNSSICVECDGPCPKECPERQITSIAEAQALSGCTKIKGNLDIQVTGGKNVVRELEIHLEKIKEITGYLKVVRNGPLISLNFLKNLEKINGEKLLSGMYALYVLDNPNLEHLWDWKNRGGLGLKILRGKVFFHYNPKLCIEKITELENITGVVKSDDIDVSKQSNGNRISCQVTELNISVVKVDVSQVIVTWRNFLTIISDPRSLLGYLISYKEAPNENVTLFDDHDACSTESWKVIDVPVNENKKDPFETELIQGLKPYTKYAIYVKTYTVVTEKNGGQSQIIYCTTKPTKPKPPVDVKISHKSPKQLTVTWKPPLFPNGVITHYIVRGTRKADSQEFLDRRNYCTEPLAKEDTSPQKEVKEPDQLFVPGSTSATSVPTGGGCPCPKDKKQQEEEEAERQFQTQFENFLHNSVYIKRIDADPFATEFQNDAALTSSTIQMRSVDALTVKSDSSYRVRRDTYRPSYTYSQELNQGSRTFKDRKTQPNAIPNLNLPIISTTNSPYNISSKAGENKQLGETLEHDNSTMNNDTFERTVNEKHIISQAVMEITIDKLKHFSEYSIEVIACQDRKSDSDVCSGGAIVTARTQAATLVDDIDPDTIVISVQNKTSNSVFIRWKVPVDPNGLIVNFHVEIKNAESDSSSNPHCLTHKEYLSKNGYLTQRLAAGNYSLRVRATSLAGPGEWTSAKYFQIPEPTSGINAVTAIVTSVCVIIFLAIVVGSGVFYYRKKVASRVPDIMYASVNPEYLSNMYIADEWEVPREKITLLKELGQGSFGMVYEGKAKDIVPDIPIVKCAVKTVNETATLRERIEFLNEASVMKAFSCHHVVKLLGVVSKGQPTLVIMELMGNGDLKSYLRSHRPDCEDNPGRHPPTLKRLLQMAVEIADGMAYLAEKKFVHRDLAARNCMVSENLTVKIGDFGMTRDIYETDYYRKGGKGLLPVRWMAPESLKDGVFTSQSDVWSYGIVLWEMATLASQPYQGLSNEQVLKYVIDGGIMEKPENCPERLYELMRGCFHYNAKYRPTFIQLIENLLADASPNFPQLSFYHNGHNGERDSREDQGNEHDDDENGADNEPSPSTPLRSPQDDVTKDEECACENDNDSSQKNKSSSYSRHFRFGKKSPHKHHHHHRHYRHQTPPPVIITSGGAVSENGSKGLSPNSSDGSKASACSANGSLLNGHVVVPMSINRTAEC